MARRSSLAVRVEERQVPESTVRDLVNLTKLEATIQKVGESQQRMEITQGKQELRLQKLEASNTAGAARWSLGEKLIGWAVALLTAAIAAGVWLK